MARRVTARPSRLRGAMGKLLCGWMLLVPAFIADSAFAGSVTVSLGSKNENSYGPHNYSFNVDVEKDVSSAGTLLVTIIGDFDATNESISLEVDGDSSIGVIYAGSGDINDKCKLINFTVVVPKALLQLKASDGEINFEFNTSSAVSSAQIGGVDCVHNGQTVKSAYIESVLTYQTVSKSAEEVYEETVSTAGSLGRSRRTVTIANLPRLSRRLSGGGFTRSAPASVPTPSAPSSVPPAPSTPSVPTGDPLGSGVGVGGSVGTNAGGFVGEVISGRGANSVGGMISGSGTAERGYLSFSSDLRSMRSAAAAHLSETDVNAAAMQANTGVYPIDIWFGGSYTYFESAAGDVSQTGDIGAVQMGVDSRLNEQLLIGVAVFGDVLFSDVSNSTETAGVGYLTGPYFVASLDNRIYLEGMAAAGQAFNRIQSPDAADARYESDRLLLTARLSGDWSYDAWSIRPSTRLTYYAEKQRGFTDSAGSFIPESTSVLGQLRFGPEIGYTLNMENASARPFVSVEGAWAFRQSDQFVDGVAVGAEELTGGLALGLDGRWGQTTFRAGGRYDGVGDESTDSFSGELTVRMPFD